jgi:hypothetical protein
MPNLHINGHTFGDDDHFGVPLTCVPIRSYKVSETLWALIKNWEKGLMDRQLTAGLIADAMDDETGVEKDAWWEALRDWMRMVFQEPEKVFVRGSWTELVSKRSLLASEQKTG